ncbi:MULTISPECIES: hypothetical protein [unclassified Streptomyces]|uniref:hypothetical protein n=1 Tax=unclassified Streptomyces TaxID=2593676 RepID=UPI001CB704BA|nr:MULTISPECIES: hypothetical protein [unclassified Streptomyces]MBD0711158.1 hypothetical protein [Streptomyces sp. CBMA291]MBD0714189.1 hypothetical protein [Streptomyces sp. CBMA370]
MTGAQIPQDQDVPAVLYVCADRGTLVPGLAARRAHDEGRAFAREHGLTIAEVVTDEYGEPDPARRHGWQRVRELARTGAVADVLVRWPTAIAPESAPDLRHRETSWLREQGVRLRYTWAPLAQAGDWPLC